MGRRKFIKISKTYRSNNMSLFRSTKSDSRPRHSHIIYLSEQEDGSLVGRTTEMQGHTHQVNVTEEGLVELLPAGKSAHIHDLDVSMEYKEEGLIEDFSDEEKVEKLKEYIKDSKELDEKSISDGELAEKYYSGEQWEDADKKALEGSDRPVITINEIAPKIDLLSGVFRQAKTDVTFYPVEGGDIEVADLSTQLNKHIFTVNNFEVVESEVFRDLLVAGRGIYYVTVDFNKNMFGDLVIDKLPWNQAHFAPYSKFDLSDCEYAIIKKYVPIKKLQQLYPEHKDKLMADRQDESYRGNKTFTRAEDYNVKPEMENKIYKKLVEVDEVWERVYETVYSVVDYDNDFVSTLNGISKSDIKELEELGFSVVRRVIKKMRVSLVSCDILLEERIEDQSWFPVLPVLCKKDFDGNFYGKIKEVLDVQNLINKLTSQSVDILNRMSAYGYYYDDQTFNTPKEEAQWKRDVSKPAFAVKVRDVQKIPLQTQGTKFPSELNTMQMEASNKMLTIMNIAQESLGFSQREVSSTAIVEKNRNAMKAQQFLMDNMENAKKYLAKLVIKTIQRVYSADRILRLVGKAPVTEEDMAEIEKLNQTIQTLLEDQELTTLDVVASLSVNSATARSASFSTLMEMSRNGMQIPPSIIIEASDLSGKDKILDILNGQQQAQAQAEQDKNQTELKKTLYAKLDPAQAQQIMGQGQQPPPQFQQ
jgi:hypothetical protein